MVDGPQSHVQRGAMRLSQLHLTKFNLKFPHTGSTRVVRKAWDTAKLDEKWAETMWAKKVEAKKKVYDLSNLYNEFYKRISIFVMMRFNCY